MADRWDDDVRLSDLEPEFTCSACGKRGADVRPDFDWDRPGAQTWAIKQGYPVLAGLRNKAIVYAELHGGDGLFDVDPRHHFGDVENGPGECDAACAEVVEVVLEFC